MEKFFDIDLFHKNLEILRGLAKLGKAEFSTLIGVKNLYRKDYNSIGLKILMGLKRNFEGVDEYWLQADHSDKKISVKFLDIQPVHVTESSASYQKEHQKTLIDMAQEILRSDSEYQIALAANIRAFYQALQTKKLLEDHDQLLTHYGQRIQDLEEQLKNHRRAHGGHTTGCKAT